VLLRSFGLLIRYALYPRRPSVWLVAISTTLSTPCFPTADSLCPPARRHPRPLLPSPRHVFLPLFGCAAPHGVTHDLILLRPLWAYSLAAATPIALLSATCLPTTVSVAAWSISSLVWHSFPHTCPSDTDQYPHWIPCPSDLHRSRCRAEWWYDWACERVRTIGMTS